MDNSLKELFNGNTPINQAVINQIILEIKQGNYHRCKAMGVSDDILQLIDSLPPTLLSELVATPVIWARVSIDQNAFMRIIQINQDKEEHRELINKAIQLGASNKMLADYFGMSSNVAARKRKLLEIPTIRGRLAQFTDEQHTLIWREWKAFVNGEPDADKFKKLEKQIEIAEKYNLNLCVLNHEIESHNLETIGDQSLINQLFRLKANIEIIRHFFYITQHKIELAQRLTKHDKLNNQIPFNSCDSSISNQIVSEWSYLINRSKVTSIYDLTKTHLKKLIKFSERHNIEFNSLWFSLTKDLKGL